MSVDEKALAESRLPADSQFGSCPECGGGEGPYNTGRLHWFVCRRHLVRWWVGENLFRCWRFETEADWQRTANWLKAFREVEPDYGEAGKNGNTTHQE